MYCMFNQTCSDQKTDNREMIEAYKIINYVKTEQSKIFTEKNVLSYNYKL